jgi:hypothetical protein
MPYSCKAGGGGADPKEGAALSRPPEVLPLGPFSSVADFPAVQTASALSSATWVIGDSKSCRELVFEQINRHADSDGFVVRFSQTASGSGTSFVAHNFLRLYPALLLILVTASIHEFKPQTICAILVGRFWEFCDILSNDCS